MQSASEHQRQAGVNSYFITLTKPFQCKGNLAKIGDQLRLDPDKLLPVGGLQYEGVTVIQAVFFPPFHE